MENSNIKSKNNFKYKKFCIYIFYILFFAFPFVSANAYALLEPLPGLDKVNVTLSDYLGWLFPFILVVASILAVIMIVIGGLELAGGGNESLKTKGKEKIESAIYGLLLAVSAYLILYTINPNLVNGKLGIDSVDVKRNESSVSSE